MSDQMQGPPPPPPPSQTPPPPPSEPPSGPGPLPYEEGRGPWLTGLWECFKLFLTDPKQAYSRMLPESALGSALFYAVIVGWIGAFFSAVWSSMIPGLGTLPGMEQFELPATGGFLAFIGRMVLAPVLILIGLFIFGGIVHVFLMLVGGANKGFVATVKVCCYAETAQIAQLVPFLGGLIALIWTVALAIIGLAQAHGTSLGKAAAAVLIPVVLCCGCAGLLLFLALAGGVAALMGQ